jgi:hypothetical protein
MGKPEGKRPIGRPRHIRLDNIKFDLGWDCVVLTELMWLSIGISEGLF